MQRNVGSHKNKTDNTFFYVVHGLSALTLATLSHYNNSAGNARSGSAWRRSAGIKAIWITVVRLSPPPSLLLLCFADCLANSRAHCGELPFYVIPWGRRPLADHMCLHLCFILPGRVFFTWNCCVFRKAGGRGGGTFYLLFFFFHLRSFPAQFLSCLSSALWINLRPPRHQSPRVRRRTRRGEIGSKGKRDEAGPDKEGSSTSVSFV